MLRNLLKSAFICIVFTLNSYGFDLLQYNLEEKHPPQLRWDNIGGKKPYWLTLGSKFNSKNYLEIKPGEEVQIRLDRNSALRVHSEDELDVNSFEASISKGSGLYYAKKLQPSTTKKDLLLADENFASVVKLKLKTTASKNYQVSFFRLRYDPIAKLAFYRNQINLKGETVQLFNGYKNNASEGDDSNLQKMHKFIAGKPVIFKVKGPTRLEIATRYMYGIKDSKEDFSYQMHIDIDNNYLDAARFIARPDRYNTYFGNNILSYPDQYYLDIKEGIHEVKLTANFGLLASVYNLNDENIAQNNINDLGTSTQKDMQEEALKMAQDVNHKASGNKAVILANNMWETREDDNHLKAANDNIKNVFTYFRDILPTGKTSLKNVVAGAVTDSNIADVIDEGKSPIVSRWQINDLTDKIILAKFVELKKVQELNYMLPELSSDSELKIIVQKGSLQSPQKFYLQYDNQKPIKLTIYPERDLDEYSYMSSYGSIGLDILERNNDVKLGTLGGLYGNNHTPTTLCDAGVAVMLLPQSTKQIKIWPAKDNANDLKIGLQYRASLKYKTPRSITKEQLKLVSKIANPSQIFTAALKFFDINHQRRETNHKINTGIEFYNYLVSTKIINENVKQYQTVIVELYNNWQDNLRFLYERHQKFVSNVLFADQTFVESKNNGKDNNILIAKAEDLMQQKQWAQATVEWSKVIENSNPDDWRIAQLARSESLKQAGESFLAERSLKALVVNANDAKTKQAAFDKLLSYYNEREYYYGTEGLIATYLLDKEERFNQEEILSSLVTALLQDGDQKKALEIADLVKNIKPSDNLVFTALKNAQGSNGNRIGEASESREEKHFWQAQILQQQGLYTASAKEFKAAGEKGAIWLKHLNEAKEISKKLLSYKSAKQQIKDEPREDILQQWQNWYYNHPGSKFWVEANYLVSSFYNGVTIYSTTEDSYAEGYVVDNLAPITMNIIGPTKFRLKIRPLFQDDKDLLAIKSWALVEIDEKKHHVKIENHRSESVLKIVGYDNYKIGLEQIEDFEVPAGKHKIKIYSQNQQVLIKPYHERPLFNITALPLVNPQTIEYLSYGINKPIYKDKLNLTNYTFIDYVPKGNLYKQISSKEQVSRDLLPPTITIKTPLAAKIKISAKEQRAAYEEQFDELNQLLYKYEQDVSDNNKHILVKAAKICAQNDTDYQINQICNSFDLLSRWSRILLVDNNPEVISFENAEKWQPDSVALNLRKSLITGETKDDIVLSDTSVLVIDFTNSETTKVKIEGELLKLIAKNSGNAVLGYKIDNGQIIKLMVDNINNKTINHQFDLDQGQHSVRFSLFDPDQETFLKLNLQEKKANETIWRPVIVPKKKEYFIATRDKPIEFTVKAPAWLQVHRISLDGAKIDEDYFIESGKKKLILKAIGGEKSFYRIFEKIPAKPKMANLQAEPKVDYQILEESPINVTALQEPETIHIKDDLPLEAQENGTWSIGTRLVQTTASDVVGTTKINVNQSRLEKGVVKFAEESASFRYYDEINRMYFKGELLAREFTQAPLSHGARARIDFIPEALPVNFFIAGNAFYQRFNHKDNHSMMSRIGMQNTLYFSRNLHHSAELSFFGRHIHFYNSKTRDNKLPDPDVYSYYSKTHNKAIDASYTLNYEPTLYNRVFIGGSYRTDKKIKKADFVSYKVGANHLINPLIFGLEYSHKKYLKGIGRSYNFNRNYLGGSLNWDYWLSNNNHRLEANFSLGKVFDAGVPSKVGDISQKRTKAWIGSLGVICHFGNGRDYRDFKSQEIEFRQLKTKNTPSKNEMRG